MKVLRGLLMTIKVHLINSLSRKMMQFVVFIEPFFSTFLLFLIYGQSDNSQAAFYIIFGSSIYSLWGNVCFSSAGDIERERFMGNLEIITASPMGLQIITLGKIIANNLLGFASFAIVFLFATFGLKVNLTIACLPLFFLSLLLVSFSFIGISLFTASLLTLSRSARLLMNFIDMPICFLSGMFFPVEILPKYIQYISYILPTTWGIKVVKNAVTGIVDVGNIFTSIAVLLVLSALYLIAAFALFVVIDRKARIKGSLGVY